MSKARWPSSALALSTATAALMWLYITTTKGTTNLSPSSPDQSRRLNHTQECPAVTARVTSDWHAASRISLTLSHPVEHAGIELHTTNWGKVSSGYKLHVESMSLDSTSFFAKTLAPATTYDLVVDKRQWHVPVTVSSIRVHLRSQSCDYNLMNPPSSSSVRGRVLADVVADNSTANNSLTVLPCSWTQARPMSIGFYHMCAINPQNAMTCWGLNNFGQSTVPSATLFVQVSAYDYHTCALNSTGFPQCWGANYTARANSPLSVVSTPAEPMASISAGALHACGVTLTGALRCWGANDFNQSSPPAGQYLSVSAGFRHACAVSFPDQRLACWGNCDNGECDPPNTTIKYVQVSAGDRYTCAVSVANNATCWGRDLPTMNFTAVPPGQYSFVGTSRAGAFSCGLLLNGSAICWGDRIAYMGLPVNVNFTRLALGTRQVCGVTAINPATNTGGTLSCYGALSSMVPTPGFRPKSVGYCIRNTSSVSSNEGMESTDLAPFNTTYSNSSSVRDDIITFPPPQDNDGSASLNLTSYQFRKVASAGNQYACGVTASGQAVCWGATNLGGPASAITNAVDITASLVYDLMCALRVTGSVTCSSLAIDTTGNFISGAFAAPRDAFVMVSSKGMHACSLKTTGRIKCWGFNDDRQLNVPDLTYLLVAAGGFHTCAITSKYETLCWGRNTQGQVSGVPVATKHRFVSCGYQFCCAIRVNDVVDCWGSDEFGEASPPPNMPVLQLAAGWGHTCAVTKSWALRCWGDNSLGQASPPAGLFYQVTTGTTHSCATAINGTVVCWGDVVRNQLTPNTAMRQAYSTLSTDQMVEAVQRNISRTRMKCSNLSWGIAYSSNLCANSNTFSGCVPPSTYATATARCTVASWVAQSGAVRLFRRMDFTPCSLGSRCSHACVAQTDSQYACTCDAGFTLGSDGMSCFPTILLRSASTCKQLHRQMLPATQMCVLNTGCTKKMTYADARTYCRSRGARLPLRQEVLGRADLTLACSHEVAFWTNTACANGLSPGFIATTSALESCQASADLATVVCVADPGTMYQLVARCKVELTMSCIDIDECELGINTCSDKCWNTEGSYTCTCDDAKALVATTTGGITCQLPSSGGDSLESAHGDTVSVPLVPSSSQTTSAKSCRQLQWTDLLTDRAICSSSRATPNNPTCPGAVNYTIAIQYCARRGARLPLLSELRSGLDVLVRSNECGYGQKLVWTSTACSRDQQPMIGVAAAGGGPQLLDKVVCLTATTQTAFPICVADKLVAGSCAAVGNNLCSDDCIDLANGFRCECGPSQRLEADGVTCTNLPPVPSPVACDGLPQPWTPPDLNNNLTDPCARSFASTTNACSGRVNFSQAVAWCASLGGRLPTAAEVANDIVLGSGATTSQRCSQDACSHLCFNQGYGYACACNQGFRLQPDGKSCLPILPDVPATLSTATCAKLNWNTIAANSTCARVVGSCASKARVTATAAIMTCMQLGARLPTLFEVMQGATLASTCGDTRVWTSTRCAYVADGLPTSSLSMTDGWLTITSSRKQPVCVSPNATFTPSCIADTVPVPICSGKCSRDQQCLVVTGTNVTSCVCGPGFNVDSSGVCQTSTPTLSTSTCSDLSWNVDSKSGLCATQRLGVVAPAWIASYLQLMAKSVQNGLRLCLPPTTWPVSLAQCKAQGSRLPTLFEIRAGLWAAYSCPSFVGQRVWTSTSCRNSTTGSVGYIATGLSSWSGANKELCLVPTSSSPFVQCAADSTLDPCTAGTHTCAHICVSQGGGSFACACNDGYRLGETGSCSPVVTARTPATCAGLQWTRRAGSAICTSGLVTRVLYDGNGSVVSNASIPYVRDSWTCSGPATYDAAVKLCDNLRARLPTMAELVNNYLANAGCADNVDVWTQTSCRPAAGPDDASNGPVFRIKAAGAPSLLNSFPRSCAATTGTDSSSNVPAVAHVRCVANV
ncbi:hypothetical protein DYB38_000931 [Aphanomyces astaci]|uniref:non-specific serine/threonine protein kinase n=2 Tax=Aphanomyces astaci TaxID=112090 RepID=A0A397CVC3_APHAT|nr:hypothetical protein DYB38_000931 [Aphanomyces astaci]